MILIRKSTSALKKTFVRVVMSILVSIHVQPTASSCEREASPSPMKAAWNAGAVGSSVRKEPLIGHCPGVDLAFVTNMDSEERK